MQWAVKIFSESWMPVTPAAPRWFADTPEEREHVKWLRCAGYMREINARGVVCFNQEGIDAVLAALKIQAAPT